MYRHSCLLHGGTTRTPTYPSSALQSDPLTGEVEGVFVTRQLSSDGAWACEEWAHRGTERDLHAAVFL